MAIGPDVIVPSRLDTPEHYFTYWTVRAALVLPVDSLHTYPTFASVCLFHTSDRTISRL